ncbi:MAG: hypothetical protein GY847_36515 [Proteobacteria bacterium]|nr:hypothetical protein [Pseudomonadota bacterium]
MLNILDDKLHVKVDQNVIIIAAEWHDPDTAKLLVEALMQSFLEEQRSRELREFNEPILILNKKLTEAKTRYHDAMGRSNDKKTEEQPKKDVYAKRKYLSKKHKIDVPPKNIDVEEIELELALKKEEIARLERTYKKRLQKAKNDLEELQITLGPQHPDYVKAARYYSILSSNPPRLGGLYTEEERLTRELENSQKSKVRIPRFNAIARPIKDNGKKDVSFQEYRQAEITYHTLVERLENARMELEAAEAAFNYRFRVTKPPEYPMRPLKPNSAKIILVGVFLGIFLGLFMAIFTDVRSGIILESWQLSRMLKIPVFGEIDEP